jgi:GNAT superfamily N-acetyltransferase
MMADKPAYNVREATEADLPALTELKTPLALHQDRLRDAEAGRLLYLIIEESGMIVGFGMLVFERPPNWSDANDTSRLPDIIDLFVRADGRSRGAGSYLISTMEDTARSKGYTHIYLGVDPVDNPRAHQLYLRLGYSPLQVQPYQLHWKFVDSGGTLHEGNDWRIDLVKALKQEAVNNYSEGTG